MISRAFNEWLKGRASVPFIDAMAGSSLHVSVNGCRALGEDDLGIENTRISAADGSVQATMSVTSSSHLHQLQPESRAIHWLIPAPILQRAWNVATALVSKIRKQRAGYPPVRLLPCHPGFARVKAAGRSIVICGYVTANGTDVLTRA